GSEGLAYDWFVRSERDYRPATMPHWFNYTLMQCRLSLTKMAKYWAEREMLVATNTDAVLLKPEADVSEYPDKGSPMPVGAWGKRTLHNVTVPAKRHLISDEKVTRPGAPKKRKPG